MVVVRALATGMLMAQQVCWAEALPESIEGVLATHPSLRSQRALGASAKQAVEAAEWQFYPTPSIAFEQVDASSPNDLSYPASGDKRTTTLRLQQPLWTGGRLSAGLSKAQFGEQASHATLEATVATVADVVKFLHVTAIGGVLRAGDELMQIAPTDEDLIVEAKVTPTDVGQLVIGQPVSVKVHLPRAQPHNAKARNIVVKPGMTVSLDVRTGKRSVLNYLAKPVFKAFGGALIER